MGNDTKESMKPDISEHGRSPEGQPVTSDRRLFMQLLAFESYLEESELIKALDASGFQGALYRDLNDPQGIALLVAHEDPAFFTEDLRSFLRTSAFGECALKDEFTMLGRTYSIGYETDLDHILVNRPLQRITNPDLSWAIWYPLRRKGTFHKLEQKEQNQILMEHGRIGVAFGEADLAQDIRLACFGLDKNDNDFVIGLLGKNLHPLSAVVQTMRKTRQTSEFIEKLGPFFIGRVIWQSGSPIQESTTGNE